MSLESALSDAWGPLVSGRCYPIVAKGKVALPYITFQQVGGKSINFLEAALPGKRNARIQGSVWADTMLEAGALARLAADTLRMVAALQVTVLGEPVATYEPETGLYGTRQDFSVWF